MRSMADNTATEDTLLIAHCASECMRLLRNNATPAGVLAAGAGGAAERRGYRRVFGRDAAICALGMTVTGDAELQRHARAGLVTLARHQAENGQIPKYVDAATQQNDFWYLGCIDATLWWLIAVDFYAHHAGDDTLQTELAPHIDRALAWLRCQEHPQLRLVQQNEASDWADIMPRSGYVLYSNSLWYHVKRRYTQPACAETHLHFNQLFHPYATALPALRRLRVLMHYARRSTPHAALYLSFVNFSAWGEEGDVFGNLLAVLMGLADSDRIQHILDAIEQAGAATLHPVRVTLTPITERGPLWRTYMYRHRQNLPYQYHNGGIWPFVGGFWVLALAAAGRPAAARHALVALARANAADDWGFREWFHGERGEPCGMLGQSWNAAMFLLARWGLDHQVF